MGGIPTLSLSLSCPAPCMPTRATRRISLGIVQRLKIKWVWWYEIAQVTGTRMANFNSKLLLRQNHQRSQWQSACFSGVRGILHGKFSTNTGQVLSGNCDDIPEAWSFEMRPGKVHVMKSHGDWVYNESIWIDMAWCDLRMIWYDLY